MQPNSCYFDTLAIDHIISIYPNDRYIQNESAIMYGNWLDKKNSVSLVFIIIEFMIKRDYCISIY